MDTEFGALTAYLSRQIPEWEFPLLEAARAAEGPRTTAASRRTTKVDVSPGAVASFLAEQAAAGSASEKLGNAALAFGAAFGTPVTLTTSLMCGEVSTVKHSSGATGVVIGIESRETGRKVCRRTATPGRHAKVWSASFCDTIGSTFVPWLLQRRASGHRHVFPAISTNGAWDDSRPVGARLLEEAIKRVNERATWHSLRVGLERALIYVHSLPGNRSIPISAETKNVLLMRSNSALRGSRDVYVQDTLEQLFDATATVHLVATRAAGGLLTEEGSEFQISAIAPPADTACRRCRRRIPLGESGAVCDFVPCGWTLCLRCFPNLMEPLLCPEHSPGGKGS